MDIPNSTLEGDPEIYSTGITLQEVLQGFSGPKSQEALLSWFLAIPMLVPETQDHVRAATIRISCRRKGVQVGTINALVAQLSIRYNLSLLTTDKDFQNMAKVVPLKMV